MKTARSAAAIDGLTLGLSGFKPAEDGEALVLRTWEPAGARGSVEVTRPEGWQLGRELNVLEDPLGPADRHFLPFKLHTWTIERS
jgi:alpha-mannosidase